MADNAPLPQGWVDEQIEGFRIMLDRDVRPFSSQSSIFIMHPSRSNMFASPTAENEGKDACKARVFGQQTTHRSVAVGPE